jgi:hypothetical protein
LLPNAATFLRTVRDTDDPIAQDKPLDIHDNYWMNNPNRTQALGWLMSSALPARECHNHIFGHLEKSPFSNWVEYTGVTETSSQATDDLTIDNVLERCAAGQLLMNTRTKEIMRLTADPDAADTTQGVVRNFGRGVATDYLQKGDKLMLILPQFEEGFTTGKGQSGVGVYKSFSTGIPSEPIQTTYTEQSEKYYAGSTPFEMDLDATWTRFNEQMENHVLWGAEKLDSSTYTQNMHTISGIYDFITTNTFTVDNTLSRMDFIDILLVLDTFYHGSIGIICSKWFRVMVTEWAYGKMEYDQEAKSLGMDITTVQLNGRYYPLLEADCLSQDYELAGTVFLCPKGKIQHRPLRNVDGIVNDVHYNPISRDEVHSKEGEIWGEFGVEYFEEECWGYIDGIQF